MGLDRREAILQRLVQIAQSIDGIKTVERNKPSISERQRPAVIVFDSSEEGTVGEFTLGRPANILRIVSMTPEIYIMAGGPKETLGGSLNAFRVALLKAILGDDQLQVLIGSGGIQYQGCITDLTLAEGVEGLMGLTFAFHYPVNVQEM